jgi:hypothetical protein
MKDNKMMRMASVLLVLALLTTCIISGTFAKYTSTSSREDTAKVAKWGVVVAGGGSLYGKNYETGTNSIPTVDTTASKLSVSYSGTDTGVGVVAPGTKSGDGLSFSISGTPEVRTSVEVSVEAQDIYLAEGTYAVMQKATVTESSFATKRTNGLYTLANAAYTKVAADAAFAFGTEYYELTGTVTVDANGYYPVTYANTVASDNTTFSGKTKVTEIAAQIAANVKGEAATEDSSTSSIKAQVKYVADKTYDPNTNLGKTLNLGENKISWEWKIDDGSSNSTNANEKDTILGDLIAVNASDTSAPVVVKVTTGTIANDTITVLTVDTDGIVKAGNDEVGSTKTSFNITLTATQVD